MSTRYQTWFLTPLQGGVNFPDIQKTFLKPFSILTRNGSLSIYKVYEEKKGQRLKIYIPNIWTLWINFLRFFYQLFLCDKMNYYDTILFLIYALFYWDNIRYRISHNPPYISNSLQPNPPIAWKIQRVPSQAGEKFKCPNLVHLKFWVLSLMLKPNLNAEPPLRM